MTKSNKLHTMNGCKLLYPLLWVLTLTAILSSTTVTASSVTDSNSNSNIRGTSSDHHHKQRKSTIEQIYGETNAKPRREIHKLETTSTHYWRTGLPDNTNDTNNTTSHVEYNDHPYELMEQQRQRHKRHLQQTQPNLTTQQINDILLNTSPHDNYRHLQQEDKFQKMRIHLSTEALQQRSTTEPDKVSFIINTILPRMQTFWQDALKVVPVAGNIRMNPGQLANSQFCGDSEFTAVPQDHINIGIPNADLVLYVSGNPSTRFCATETLAVAIACNFDNYDRPVAGAINFCLNHVELDNDGSAHESIIDDNVDVAIHEAAHVLGMSSNSFRYFWDPETGMRRTSRPFSLSTVTCVDNEVRSEYLPDVNTLRFGVNGLGKRHASIVTKTVRTVVQNQFDCTELEGGQLENQPTGAGSCTGDHWDERLFYPEALSGVIAKSSNFLSPLTLALLEDSGWYKANFVQARISPWGHGAGCPFVNEPCIQTNTNGETIVPPFGQDIFCTSSTDQGCSPSHQYKMGCTLINYSVRFTDRSPPIEFQYFPGEPELGGPQQADYCPLYGSIYKSNARYLDCEDRSNGNGLGYFSEEFGSDSMCFNTDSGEGRCYVAKCIPTEHQVRINVRGEWFTCTHDFQKIEAKVSSTALVPIVITCPRLSQACPEMFCPANCGGRGICDFQHEVNGTIQPKCNCFNESDTSAGCTETMDLDGKYLDSADDLVNNKKQSIFDALVAVFIDNPSSWSTASWVWASCIFVLFLLIVLCICSSLMPSKRGRNKVPRSDDY